MPITWTFLEVLTVGAIVGLVTHFLLRRVKRRWIKATALVVVGSVTGLCAYMLSALSFAILAQTPASDDVVARRQELRLDIQPDSPSFRTPQGVWDFDTDPRRALSPRFTLQFAYSAKVKKNEDFTLYVTASSKKQDFEENRYVFGLSAPQTANVRTSFRCDGLPSATAENAACGEGKRSAVQVAWDITLKEPATAVLAITVPKALMNEIMRTENWIAIPSHDDRIIMRSARRSPFSPWRGGDPRDELVPFLLSPQVSYLESEGSQIDLRSAQVRLRTEAVETLGVSNQTLQILGWGGSIVSGLLGTGWIWQIITWRRQRQSSTLIIKP